MKKHIFITALIMWILTPAKAQDSLSTTGELPSSEVFIFVEQMPEFPGGLEKMQEFISSNIKYPSKALQNGIQGKVIITFIVNRYGKITDITQIGKQLGFGLDEEAIRVVKLMPDWKPGKQNGKSVNVKYTLPVNFKLQ